MKTLKTRTPSIGLLLLASIVISLSGCATKKASWGSMKTGMIMRYNLQPGQDLTYINTHHFEQNAEVMDQTIHITSKGDLELNMIPVSLQNEILDYTVTIVDMSTVITTPRGDMEAELDDVIGKSFNLQINTLGKELNYAEAEAITYDYSTGETRSIASEIQTFFPNLPGEAILAGDTWLSFDTISETFDGSSMVMTFDNINTFAGLEKFSGYDCMKITTTFTGTFDGKANQDGMDLITSGTLSGNSSWYFAYKVGIFLSQESIGEAVTNTLVKGPQEINIPSTRKYTVVSKLK